MLIEGAVFALFGALLGLLCARHWGPYLAGVTALSFTIAALCAMVAQLGTDQVVITRFVQDQDPGRLIRSVLALRALSTLLALAGIAASTFAFADTLGAWLLLPLLIFVQCALGVADVLRLRAQALNSLHRQSPWRIAVATLFFGAKFLALVRRPAQDSVWLVAWLNIAESAVLLGISAWVSRRFDPWPPASPQAGIRLRDELRQLAAASVPLFAAGFAVMAFLRLDYFALAEWADSRQLGLYASSMRVLELYLAVGNLALLQFLPELVRSHRDSRERYERQLRTAFGLAYLIGGGIVVFNALAGAPLITWVLGAEYTPVAAASTLICLLGVPLLSGTVRGFAISIQALHHHHLYCALLGLALGLPLLAWLVPALGFRGALWADGLTYLTTAMVSSWAFPALRGIGRAQWRPSLDLAAWRKEAA
ncbi:MAG TPA: oligosaccharide flippase family protein [Roseateles sp.]